MVRGMEYVNSPSVRRAAFEASLVNPPNGYSQVRTERYTEERWGALPLWNPPARSIGLGESPPERLVDGQALSYEHVPWTHEALIELGARAFFDYPIQITPALHIAIEDPEQYGIVVDGDRLPTLVWTRTDGGIFPALTCASCHADRDQDGRWHAGRTNPNFNYGQLFEDFYGTRSARGRWGPAKVDVTVDGLVNPTVVTDLRPIAHQRYLHRAATLYNDPIALAVRLETLIITATGQVVRPPRKVIFAMALYLWSLADSLPPIPADKAGHAVFERECSGCHGGEGLVGEPIPLETVGTDPWVGLSGSRGTGMYRVPSLRGVGDRTPLFAAGGVSDLEELLDPARAAVGHTYGLALPADERDALLEYLRAL